jgi:hypothetical protein
MSNAPLQLVGHLESGQLASVEVRNARPLAAGLLVGKSPEEAALLAGNVFSLCGVAQRHAVRAACATARGVELDYDEATERALTIESIQLHLWRLLLDWPTLFELAPVRERFGVLHRRLAQARDHAAVFEVGGQILNLVADELLGGFFMNLREPRNLREFAAACQRAGTVGHVLARLIDAGASDPMEDSVPLLPALPAAALAAAIPAGWPDEAFCREPHLNGSACETGPLARHVGNPLVARLLSHRHRIAARLFARVVELSDCATRLRYPLTHDMPTLIDTAPLPDGGALARVDTARGVLLHAVRLDGDTVADYAIVAPTEWNFCPGGVFEKEGAGWAAPDPAYARWRLRALALALDPCVNFDVRVDTEEVATHA